MSTHYGLHSGVTASHDQGNDSDLLELYRDYALAADALADALAPDDDLGTVVRWAAEQARRHAVVDSGGVLPLRLFGDDTGSTVA